MGEPGQRSHREVSGDRAAPGIPAKLSALLEALRLIQDRGERIQVLIGIANRFKGVPDRIAARPYPDEHRVPGCESQAFVWAEDLLL